MKLLGYSTLSDEVLELGIPNEPIEDLVDLGEMLATGHPNLIITVEAPLPTLQKWEKS